LLRSRRAVVSEFISRCGKLTDPGMWPAMYASRERVDHDDGGKAGLEIDG
jgi:hypothetical protein